MFLSTLIRGCKETTNLCGFCRKWTPVKLVFYAPMTPTGAMSQKAKPTTFTCCLVSFAFLKHVLVTFRYYINLLQPRFQLGARLFLCLHCRSCRERRILRCKPDFSWLFRFLYAMRIYISKEQRAIGRRPRGIDALSDRARKIRNTFPSAEVLLASFFHLSLIRNRKLGQLSWFVFKIIWSWNTYGKIGLFMLKYGHCLLFKKHFY